MDVYLVKESNRDYYECWNVVAVCLSKESAEAEIKKRFYYPSGRKRPENAYHEPSDFFEVEKMVVTE